MKEKLMNNAVLKIGSLFFAIILWFIVNNNINPVKQWQIKNVPVEVLNANIITDQNKAYEITEGATVNIIVSARQSYYNLIKASDFSVTADFNSLLYGTDSTKMATNIVVKVINNESNIEGAVPNISTMRISVEDLQEKVFPVTAYSEGKVAADYVLQGYSLSTATVAIKVKESVMSLVDTVKVKINVEGATANVEAVAQPEFYDSSGTLLDLYSEASFELSNPQIVVTANILGTKTLELNPKVTGIPAEGYKYIGWDSDVKSVVVAGPKDVLDSLEKLDLPPVDITDVAATFTKSDIDLNQYLPDSVQLVGNNSVISITFTMQKLDTKVFTIPKSDISFRNTVDGYSYDIQEDSINVIVEGLTEDLESLEASALEPRINASGLSVGTHTVSVQVTLKNSGFTLYNEVMATVIIQDTSTTQSPTTATPTAQSQTQSTSITADTPVNSSGNTSTMQSMTSGAETTVSEVTTASENAAADSLSNSSEENNSISTAIANSDDL